MQYNLKKKKKPFDLLNNMVPILILIKPFYNIKKSFLRMRIFSRLNKQNRKNPDPASTESGPDPQLWMPEMENCIYKKIDAWMTSHISVTFRFEKTLDHNSTK